MENDTNYWNRQSSRGVSRRAVLRGGALGGVGVAAAALVGCSSSNNGKSSSVATSGAAAQASSVAKASSVATSGAVAQASSAATVVSTPAAAAQGGTPKTGGRLSLISPAEGAHWDPHQTTEPHTQTTWQLIGSNLLWQDPVTFTINPNVGLTPQQPDAQTIIIQLNKGVKFDSRAPYNGRELTSADVKFTYEHISTDSRSVRKDQLADMDHIETPDPYTVKFVLKRPSAPFLINVADPNHLLIGKELLDIAGDLRQSKTLFGSGPFIVDQLQPGVSISFKKNPNYFKPGRPYLDSVLLTAITDTSTRDAFFLTGKADIAYGSITQAQKKDISGKISDTVFSPAGSLAPRYVVWNWQRKPYDDLRVRQAINLILDRKQIIDLIDDGTGLLSVGPIPPALVTWALSQDEVSKLPGFRADKTADITQAKQLMAAAGFASGFKAASPSSQQYDFSFLKVATVAAPMLKAIGIDLQITADADYSAFLAKQAAGEFDIIVGTASIQAVDPDTHLNLLVQTKGGRNYGFYSDPQVDAQVAKQRVTLDTTARKAIVADIQHYLATNLDRGWSDTGSGVRAMRGWVKGWKEPAVSVQLDYLHEGTWLDGKPA